jgi:hypothetical protein
MARPEAVVSELAASATMPVRAVQCREIARRIDRRTSMHPRRIDIGRKNSLRFPNNKNVFR